jgi:Fe2+ transport system protein FeoA
MNKAKNHKTLENALPNKPMRILAIKESPLSYRMMELGVIPGEKICISHFGPLGLDPIAIRVRGAHLALRREEARLIEVEELTQEQLESSVALKNSLQECR